MHSTKEHAAIQAMKEFNAEFNDAKECYKNMQNWHVNFYKKHKVPTGVFIPDANLYDVSVRLFAADMQNKLAVNDLYTHSVSTRSYLKYYWGLWIFGTWRNTLSIYQIDGAIIESVAKSPIPDDTPISIYAHLPEWVSYIEIQNEAAVRIETNGGTDVVNLIGFWAGINYNYDTQQKVLCLTPHFDGLSNTAYDCYQPILLPIADGLTVKQAVNIFYKCGLSSTETMSDNHRKDFAMCYIMLSCLLWLCAEKPDISNINDIIVTRTDIAKPKFGINKKTGAFIPPSQATLYYIGKRLGGEVRQMKDQLERDGETKQAGRKRPHIRKGHWHGFWSGPRDEARKYKVQWIPAIFVNGG